MAKTKELTKSPFMGQKKAKNRHVSMERAVSRERLFLFSAPLRDHSEEA